MVSWVFVKTSAIVINKQNVASLDVLLSIEQHSGLAVIHKFHRLNILLHPSHSLRIVNTTQKFTNVCKFIWADV